MRTGIKSLGLVAMSFILVNPILYGMSVVHLSDMHSGGAETHDLFNVIDCANREMANICIVTGDVVNCGMQTYLDYDLPDVVDYEVARTILRKDWFVVPGNHEYAWTGYGGAAEFEKRIGGRHKFRDVDNWRFIGIDLGVPYSHDAFVDPNELHWLERCLQNAGDKYCALCIHAPMSSGYILNEEALLDVCRKYNVKLILAGHIHKNAAYITNGIPVIVTGAAYEGCYSVLNIQDKKVELIRKNALIQTNSQSSCQIYDENGQLDPRGILERKEATKRKDLFIPQYAEYKTEDAAIYAPILRTNGHLYFSNSAGSLWSLRLPPDGVKFTDESFKKALCKLGDFKGNLAFPFCDGNGTIYWLSDCGQLILPNGCVRLRHTISSQPIIYNGIIAVGTIEGVVVLYDMANMKTLREIDLGTALSVSGIAADQNGIYVCLLDETIRSVGWDGKLRWINKLNDKNYNYSIYPSVPLLHDGIVYLSSNDKKVLAVSCDNGSKLWEHEMGVCNAFTPVLTRDESMESKRVVVGDMSGSLYAFNLQSGERTTLCKSAGQQIITGTVTGDGAFLNCWNGYLIQCSKGEKRTWQYDVPAHYSRHDPIPLSKELLLPCWNGTFLSFPLLSDKNN